MYLIVPREGDKLYSSKSEKLKFIYDYITRNGMNLKVQDDFAMLMRNNGLTNTIIYLVIKNQKENEKFYYESLVDLCIKYFKKYIKVLSEKKTELNEFLKFLVDIQEHNSKRYIQLTKDFYEFFDVLRTLQKVDTLCEGETYKYLNKKKKDFDPRELNKNNLDNDPKNLNILINKNIEYELIKRKLKHNIDAGKLEQLCKNNEGVYGKIIKNLESISKFYSSVFKENLIYEVENKMVIGLGERSVRERSIKLDHIYGIPFIPASTLKGAFRNFMENEYSFDCVKNEKDNLIKEIKDAFGTQGKQGYLIFMDTYPKKGFKLGVDIMTPHYKEYYTQGKVPLDNNDVTPIEFIVMKQGQFNFNLYVEKDLDKYTNIHFIKEGFRLFLANAGLGAKKAVGYGYFTQVKEEGNSSE